LIRKSLLSGENHHFIRKGHIDSRKIKEIFDIFDENITLEEI